MDNDELVPGLEIIHTEEDPEVIEHRELLAQKVVLSAEEVEKKKKQILNALKVELDHGSRVEITDEMRELGIDREAQAIIFEHYGRGKIMTRLMTEDDELDYKDSLFYALVT